MSVEDKLIKIIRYMESDELFRLIIPFAFPDYLAMALRRKLEFPALTPKEIKLYKRALTSVKKNPIRIFEWGAGYSTIYFPKFLKSKGIKFDWYSVENSRYWYEKIIMLLKKKRLSNCVKLYLFEFAPFWEKPGWDWKSPPLCGQFSPKSENEIGYIQHPKTLNLKFDVLLIDGRFRRHCLEVAKEVLSDGGFILMHDAHKKHYHAPMKSFTFSKFIDGGKEWLGDDVFKQVWVGSMGNKEIVNMLEEFN